MKIIHFSDPHAGAFPDSFSAFFDKRIVGTFNYLFRRQFMHNIELLKKAVDFILAEQPDAVVCTGDLTTTGQPAEFDIILDILAPLTEHPDIKMIYVPGNHDAYVKNSRCRNAMEETFKKLNGGLSIESLPALRQIGECDFLLLNECRPTNIFLSTGYITNDDSQKLTELCELRGKRPRILVGHFPLKKKYDGLLEFRHKIYGHEKVETLLNDGNVDLSLCGHAHNTYMKINESGKGELCVGSITKNGEMLIVKYDRSSGTFSHKIHSVSDI